MQQEPGDDYLRRLSSFVHTHERNLAEAGFRGRRRPQHPPDPSPYVLNPLSWFNSDARNQPASVPKPVVLSLDTHCLFYVLMRMEALDFNVGTLDVHVENPSRPTSYINIFSQDKSETLSLASFRSSLSAVSHLSLGGGWFGRQEPLSVDSELKYLYSSFTKIPALRVKAPGRKGISELMDQPPNQNALPLDAFKNLQRLECVDVDPRTLLGWDRLAEGLISLKIEKSGVEDMADVLIGAVIDDLARRAGSMSRQRQRRIPRGRRRHDVPFFATRLPESVPEETDAEENATNEAKDSQIEPEEGTSSPPPPTELSETKWALLKHLSLHDNGLTSFPSDAIPYLTSLTHLDLSSNLLVSVPPCLGALYNLHSLNLSDNMIDSVLGIYLNLGQVLILNVAHNRLESLCGLERLVALEQVDLRGNLVEESAEVGRLAVLPNIKEVWIEGNPLSEVEDGYRVSCFGYFLKEDKTILLDGSSPGFYEKMSLTTPPPKQTSRPISTVPSPPVVAVGHHKPDQATPQVSSKYPTPPSSNGSPSLSPIGVSAGTKPRRKRIVELDSELSDSSSQAAGGHSRERSVASVQTKPKRKSKLKNPKGANPPLVVDPPSARKWGQIGTYDLTNEVQQLQPPTLQVEQSTPPENISSTVASSSEPENVRRRARHGRYQTEFLPTNFASSSQFAMPSEQEEFDTVDPTVPIRSNRASATFSSKSGKRRARMSASMWEAPVTASDEDGARDIKDTADAHRRRIDALRKDMGDGWLKVYSQSQLKTRSP